MRVMTDRAQASGISARGPRGGLRQLAFALVAVYAMLLQGFFGGLLAAERIGQPSLAAALCLSVEGEGSASHPGAPAGHGAHECVCLAACHGGFAPPAGPAALARPAAAAPAQARAPALPAALFAAAPPPPARGPPHAGQSLFA